MATIRDYLRSELLQAMKARQSTTVRVLRSLLAAIDNAEAVEFHAPVEPTYGHSADVPRKVLTERQIRAVIEHEAEERRVAKAQYEQFGTQAAADQMGAELDIILRVLAVFPLADEQVERPTSRTQTRTDAGEGPTLA